MQIPHKSNSDAARVNPLASGPLQQPATQRVADEFKAFCEAHRAPPDIRDTTMHNLMAKVEPPVLDIVSAR
jgi:hypothetical protein